MAAMARSGPTTLALPPFSGATRRLILINVGVFFGLLLLGLILPSRVYGPLEAHLPLTPVELFHGQIWQLFTYSFLPLGILGTLFAMLTLWFTGSMLESQFGSRWLLELYFLSSVGGGLLACLLTATHLLRLDPTQVVGYGAYGGIYGLLIAVAVFFGNVEFLVFFLLRVKVKYLVAIYILIDLATLLKSGSASPALLHLSGAVCGFIFLRLAPRKGLAHGVSESLFAVRNEFYRSKRKRAARQFEVYMRKQNREVRFDSDGRYIDPDAAGSPPRDASDKRWMN